ncbi:hypothetical protein BH18ACT1_BH18ACT1_14840 [soil metagenome]|nr:hypothetical protein [Acidimicrobiia bacterium]
MTYQDIAKDTLYVTVGLGVLAFQRAQVARQELTKVVESQLGDARENLGNLGGTLEDRIKVLEQRFEGLQEQVEDVLDTVEERVESFLGEVEDRVPESAKEWFSAARDAAKDARGQVRHLVNSSRESAAA